MHCAVWLHCSYKTNKVSIYIYLSVYPSILFQVIVNSSLFLEHLHRLPVSRVNTIVVDGGVEITSIAFQNPAVKTDLSSQRRRGPEASWSWIPKQPWISLEYAKTLAERNPETDGCFFRCRCSCRTFSNVRISVIYVYCLNVSLHWYCAIFLHRHLLHTVLHLRTTYPIILCSIGTLLDELAQCSEVERCVLLMQRHSKHVWAD